MKKYKLQRKACRRFKISRNLLKTNKKRQGRKKVSLSTLKEVNNFYEVNAMQLPVKTFVSKKLERHDTSWTGESPYFMLSIKKHIQTNQYRHRYFTHSVQNTSTQNSKPKTTVACASTARTLNWNWKFSHLVHHLKNAARICMHSQNSPHTRRCRVSLHKMHQQKLQRMWSSETIVWRGLQQ